MPIHSHWYAGKVIAQEIQKPPLELSADGSVNLTPIDLAGLMAKLQSITHDVSNFLRVHGRSFVQRSIEEAAHGRREIHIEDICFNDMAPDGPPLEVIQTFSPPRAMGPGIYMDINISYGLPPLELVVWMGNHMEGVGRFRIELGELIGEILKKYGRLINLFEKPETIEEAKRLKTALEGEPATGSMGATQRCLYDPNKTKAPHPIEIPFRPITGLDPGQF